MGESFQEFLCLPGPVAPRKSVVSFMIVSGNTFPTSKRSGLWAQCFAKMSSARGGLKVLGCSLPGLALLAGCSEPEGIREYAAPRDAIAKPAPAMAAAAAVAGRFVDFRAL